MRGTQEFDELQAHFERNAIHLPYLSATPTRAMRAKRYDNGEWPPYFYENGSVDLAFRCYMAGYAYSKSLFATAGGI
jgi:hypothetical protein